MSLAPSYLFEKEVHGVTDVKEISENEVEWTRRLTLTETTREQVCALALILFNPNTRRPSSS